MVPGNARFLVHFCVNEIIKLNPMFAILIVILLQKQEAAYEYHKQSLLLQSLKNMLFKKNRDISFYWSIKQRYRSAGFSFYFRSH